MPLDLSLSLSLGSRCISQVTDGEDKPFIPVSGITLDDHTTAVTMDDHTTAVNTG
jgi:hypothetical protein